MNALKSVARTQRVNRAHCTQSVCNISPKHNPHNNIKKIYNKINAFSKLVDEIERYIILQEKTYTITELLDMLKTFDTW